MEFENENRTPGWLSKIDRSGTDLERSARLQKSAIALGFVLVAIATYLSHVNPATGFEVSVYAGTPPAAWAAAGVAMGIALVGATAARTVRLLGLAVGLAGTVVTWVIAQPVLRGYHFYGFNDSLTHLGWVSALSDATMSPMDIVYPAVHLTSAAVSELGGATTTLSMQLVVVSFALAYLVFVPLLAYRLAPDVRVAAVAAFGAFLFLPVNLGGFKLMFYPFSMAAFLAPLVLYLLVRHATTGPADERPTSAFSPTAQFLTRSAGLFALASLGIVVVHPQAAFDLFVLLVGLLVAKGLFATRWQTVADERLRPVSGLAALYAAIFISWSLQFQAFYDFLATLSGSLTGVFFGESGLFTIVSQRSESASDVGAGVVDVFWKLFFVDAVFLALAFGLTWALAARRLDLPGRSLASRHTLPDRGGETLAISLGVGMAVFLPYAAVHLLGDVSEANYFFRHLGFLMIPGTVLGSIGAVAVGRKLAAAWSGTRVKQTGAVVAAAVVVLSLVTVFPSPFVYLPSNHVTSQEMAGFQTTFAHADDTPLVTVRGIGHRHAERSQLVAAQPFGARLTPDRLASPDSPVGAGEMVLFGVPERTVESEVVAFRGLRYPASYFESVETTAGVNHVVENGEYDLYYTESPTVRKDTTN